MRRLALLGVLLAGCASQSRPVTIAAALDELQDQLQAAGAVSVVGAGPIRFAQAARDAQCRARAANPELPILTHDITINLSGSFTATGGFALGPAITGGPPFGISSSLARAQTQELTLPLTFAALSELPDVAAAQRIALYTGLPAEPRNTGIRRVLAERDTLRRQTIALISAFDVRRCPTGTPPSRSVWHPFLRPAKAHTP